MTWGIALLAASIAAAAVLVATQAPPAWRAGLMAPLWGAGLGIFQARAKT